MIKPKVKVIINSTDGTITTIEGNLREIIEILSVFQLQETGSEYKKLKTK